MKIFFPPVWFPDRDVSSGALFLLRFPGIDDSVLVKPLDHFFHLREAPSVCVYDVVHLREALSVREYDVESLNNISEEAETPHEHPVASSLDVTSKMDVTAGTSRGEHPPLSQHSVVLHSDIQLQK